MQEQENNDMSAFRLALQGELCWDGRQGGHAMASDRYHMTYTNPTFYSIKTKQMQPQEIGTTILGTGLARRVRWESPQARESSTRARWLQGGEIVERFQGW